ncbi:MAG: YafY family protein [Pseudomonadota bacterium]
MRRADRLLRIIDILRGGRLVTARDLAERMEVSERTIYRDIAHLIGNRVPIEGEAGVGYMMRDGYDLPPLMFTAEEVVALVGGARLIRAWGGTRMAGAAEAALDKIAAVLPEPAAARAGSVHIHAFRPYHQTSAQTELLDAIETATEAHCYLSFPYQDAQGRQTVRQVRPLGLWFWGKVWTMVAWCELRDDFRMFRIDRMGETMQGPPFPREARASLEAFRLCEPDLPPER